KLDDVLHGLVIQSGNDAAIALAEHVGGSEAAFVDMMNAYAAKLGMSGSHFENAHGLTAEGHLMTARDIATLSRALISHFPEHYALYKIKEFTYNGIQQYNRNGLLWKDDSVDGLKTGHTSAAGYCLAASAKRGDQRLVSVVLGIDTDSRNDGFRLREQGNLALLNWGFRHFETHSVYGAGEQVAEHPVWRGAAETVSLGVAEPLLVTVPRGRYGELKPSMDVPRQLMAPITKGQAIGSLRLSLDGELVAERPLVALEDVAEGGFFKRMSDDFWLWWESE
ncbi:MAG TPA: D-alanyl-D-alanine carboxypeptidase family protein, partial [Arenimonas sp.]|nr:D-alanyl-D-alanine carboxypeptidase family protein [Arenimonas sp.]